MICQCGHYQADHHRPYDGCYWTSCGCVRFTLPAGSTGNHEVPIKTATDCLTSSPGGSSGQVGPPGYSGILPDYLL